MSLNVALSTAANGISVIENKISVTSQNITNAGTAGYTAKTYVPDYVTTDEGTVAIGGEVQSTVDQFLLQSEVSQTSDYQMKNVIATYLSEYDDSLGSTSSTDSSSSGSSTDTTLSSDMNNLTSAISSLSSDASSSSAKSAVVSDAEVVASDLNGLSSDLQNARLQASDAISTSVSTVNSTLTDIASLNQQIASAPSGTDIADLEDQRNTDLTTLAGQMGITYYTDSSNQVQVYTSSGDQLVSGSSASQPSYTAPSQISSTTTYPDNGISGIMLNGQDITDDITSGTIGGLVQLRDTTLVNEQSKLDALSDTLQTTVNTITNQGASVPSRTTMTGSTAVSSSDSFSGTGTVRIAVTDSSGNVVSYSDLDLSSYSTVGDLVTALNGISGISASISSNGNLVLSSTDSSDGVSINEMTSSVGGSDEGFSMYFGLNNLFDSTNGASDIQVSSYLQDSSDYLATGSLSDSSTLAAGDAGVTSGDGSVMTSLLSALDGTVSFSAAGGFAAQTSTISDYVNSIISSVATSSSDATSASDSSNSLLTTIQDNISNESGVDVDQQTANATLFENAYDATAQLMETIEQMFSTLMSAVSAQG